MKKYKQIGLGICLAALLLITFQLNTPNTYAASRPQDSNTSDFYSACVVNIVNGLSNDMCSFSKDGFQHLLYDGLDDLQTNQVNYLASSSSTTVTAGGTSVSIPNSLTLLNSANQPLFSGSLAKDSNTYGAISYTNHAYGTYDPTSKYSTIGQSYAKGYVVYSNPHVSTLAFLASVNTDGSLQVLAEVYNVIQPSSNTSAGMVYAAKINKQAEARDNKGAVIVNVTKGSACTGGTDCVNGACSKDNGDCTSATTETACEQNSGGWSFAWAVCPVLDAANGLTTLMVNTFEGQLSFSVAQLGSSTDPTSGASKLHESWALIRDISTALVVIVMLIMVFSQAVSFGPFDAYTIRKLLPKLVAAVILIQISWVGVSWIIDLVNAISRGVADLMYYPFGGASNMDLWHLLHNAKLSDVLLGVMDWGALLVFVALGVAFLFTMLGVAFVAITALFFAVMTLVFRKILLIILLIFSPLALIAWILPGTDRYWKMWRENFLKALFMFPIAVAIVAAGRIFAYVVGTQDNGQFLNLIFVVVGFFGPLFILPKTFKWGGQAMQLAGNGIMKAGSKVSERPKKFMDTRQEGLSAYRRHQSQERFANKEGFNWKKPKSYYRRPIDLLKSGKWDPTLTGQRSQDAQDAYVHAGEETYQKNIEASRSRVLREGQDVRAHQGNWDRYFQMVADGVDEYRDEGYLNDDGTRGRTIKIGKRSDVERDAARKQTAILGSATNWRFLEDYYQRSQDPNSNMTPADRAHARKFFDDNVSTIMPKMSHVYQGYAAAADATGATLAGQHGVEVESILGKLSADIQDSSKSPEARASAQRSLVTYLQNFQAAANNPNISLDNGALRAVKAFIDSGGGADFRDSINNDPDPRTGAPRPDGRATRHLPTIEAYDGLALDPSAKAELDRIKADLAPKISGVTGTLSSVGESPVSAQPTSSGNFPAPGSTTWTPTQGTNTRFNPGEGETRIQHNDDEEQ